MAKNSASGNPKQLIQQTFHPCMFEQKQTSSQTVATNLNTNKTTQPINQPMSTIDIEHNQPISSSNENLSPGSQQHSESVNKPTTNINNNQPPPWQKVPESNKKKRKIGALYNDKSPETIQTSNSFAGLAVDSVPTVPQPPESKPPPIMLYGIQDVRELTKELLTVTDKTKFTVKIINKNQLRLSCTNIEEYKIIIDHIRNLNLIGHTFTPRQNKCHRIVIKNLHHTTPHEEIRYEIEKTGNKVRGEIVNARGPEKQPTSTFFVNVEPGPNNKSLKEIKHIYYQSIVIEDPKKKREIVQCHRCQQYGHSKNNCMRPFRCLKCGDGHNTTDCTKKRDTPATCALCSEEHPANYKGCQVYKEIMSRKSMPRHNTKPTPVIQPPNKTNTTPAKPQRNVAATPWNKIVRSTNQDTIHKQTTVAASRTANNPISHRSTQNANEQTWTQQDQRHQEPDPDNTQYEDKDNFNRISQLLERYLHEQSLKMDMLMNQISNLLNVITNIMPALVQK